MELDNENAEEDFQEQLIEKIKNYYKSNPPITSHDELDNFLSAIDLLEIWNSDDEKEQVWQCISKYTKDSKIDCDGAIQGLKDLLNQEDIQESSEKEPGQKETFLTRLSRLSTRGGGGIQGPTNKLALNKYKQRAIDEYDCLDSMSLIQFKKIFVLLKLNTSNNKIKFDDLNVICSKHKFIKIETSEIWRYLSFCVYEENLKNLENKKEYIINNDILEEVQAFIDQKIINEDLDYDSDILERENDNDSVSSEGNKKYLDEDAMILISKIIKKSININENNMILIEIKNDIRKLNNNMVENGYKILHKEELTMDNMENDKELINEKIYQIEEFFNKTRSENEININKMESLKENIQKMNENIKIMKKDYKDLLEKYNSNQQIDIDEETERLIDENMMLTQEKENKELEIEKLLEEKKNMRKDYQNLVMQYEDVMREKNELAQEASEIKINNYKLKNDYEQLLNDFMNKMDEKEKEKEKKSKKKEKKDDKKDGRKTISYEDQIKELKILNNSSIDDGEKIVRKRNILKEMANEKLINYILEIDKINQSLSNERNKKEQKIYELNQKSVELNDQIKLLNQKNVELEEENKNMQKKIEDLNNDVKNNELFRPSIAMNSQMRISRLSKLNTVGINEKKFKFAKGAGFSTKKNVQTFKLKDKEDNKKNEGQKTKTENITMALYGVKEVEDEEEDQENNETTDNKNKAEFKTSNQKDFTISNTGTKNNEMNISNNNDINIKGNEINTNAKKNEMGISNNNDININGSNDDKDKKSNNAPNTINSNNSINITGNNNEIKTNDISSHKKEFSIGTNSSNVEISGNNKAFNNLKQDGIVFNINSEFNTLSNNGDPNAVIEVENITDINLTSGNTITFGDKEETSNKKNNNLFETQNNNLFIKKEDKDKDKNESSHITSISFFETKPHEKVETSSVPEKKEEKKESKEIKETKQDKDEEDVLEEMPTLKIDNLMGNLLDNETITKNASDSSSINKNANSIMSIKKNEEKDNKNTTEISKENNININRDSKNSELSKKDDLERATTSTIVYNNAQRSTGNLEDIMFTGIQKEGFNIDSSSRNESFMTNNSNSINIKGEKMSVQSQKEEQNKGKINKEYQIEKNKGREIVMTSSTKMFQNTKNDTTNSFAISSNNMHNSLLPTKTLADKNNNYELRGSNKIQLLPSHKNSISSNNFMQSSYRINVLGPKSKSELEEMRNNNNDYYSLFQEEYIQKKLKEENDNCTEFEIYTDQIFLFLDKKHISKRFIMLTPSNLYIIEPKEMKFVKVIKKEKILSFQISNKNINIILFQINDGDNILIETLRRMDLLLYLRDHYRNNKNIIKFKYEDQFIVNIKGKATTVSIKDKIFANLSNFDGAQKIGYLLKYKGKFIGTIFKEKLFILTSIGLIMFDEPSSPPKKLYPIIGSNIEKIEGTKYGRENCFKITFLSGKSKIFATRKKRERDSWLKEFDRIAKEFQTKMKQLDTMNKKFIENSDKSLLPPGKEEEKINDKNN